MSATAPTSVERIGIVGAGVMGAGIAQVAAEAGFAVVLTDARPGAAERAKADIAARLAKRVADGRLPPADRDAVLARLTPGSLADMADADLVIEAIIEDMGAKQQLFRDLDGIVRPDAILATNTSALSVTALAAGTAHPGRVAGLHFFNPVPVMKLVEIVRGLATAPAVVEALRAVTAQLGKTGVVVADTPGFLVNHAGRAYVTEALHILSEGVADVPTIDAVMRDCCGFKLGPFELLDLTGLDVNHPVSETVHAGFYGEPRVRTVPLHRAMRMGGLLGRKTGHGFYVYGPDGAKVLPDVPSVPAVPPPAALVMPVPDDPARQLFDGVPILTSDDGRSPVVASLLGEDAATAIAARGYDARRFVAVDALFASPARVTLMRTTGSDRAVAQSVAAAIGGGRAVSIIEESPGFIAQRIMAQIINLAAAIAQQRIATPADVDAAVRLGLAYPQGPLAWADSLGLSRVIAVSNAIFACQGDDRYRPSPWLKRRETLGLSALAE